MSNLTDTPAQVLEVHNAMIANAREADFEEWVVYTRPETSYGRVVVYTRPETSYGQRYVHEPTGNWIVGCNFEAVGPSMIFKDGVWFYRSSHTGEDEPMKGGHEEALANANCFFTG